MTKTVFVLHADYPQNVDSNEIRVYVHLEAAINQMRTLIKNEVDELIRHYGEVYVEDYIDKLRSDDFDVQLDAWLDMQSGWLDPVMYLHLSEEPVNQEES